MATSLTVRLEPATVTLGADQEAAFTVTIANASDRVDHYAVDLLGLPEGTAVRTSPEVCKLQPGGIGDVEVTVTADPVRPPIAGRQVVGVRVSSPYRTDVTRTAELELEVLPAPGLELALAPEVVSGGDRDVSVDLVNQGNTPLDVQLGGQDTEGRVALVFTPPSVRLAPREEARVHLRLRARRPLSGTDVRRQVSVVATSQAGERKAAVVLVQRPLVPGGVSRLVAAAAGVAVLAAAVVTSAVLVVNQVKKAAGSGSAQPTASVSGQAVPDGSADSTTTTTPTSTTPTTSTQGAGQPVVVDLTTPPSGKPTQNQVLEPNAYSDLVLSAVRDPSSKDCASVTSASFLTLAGNRPVVVPGAFGVNTAGQTVGTCTTLPLRIGLKSPASQVTVQLIGAQVGNASAATVAYALTAQGAGSGVSTEVAVNAPGTLTLTDSTGKGISEVVLTGNPPGGTTVPAVTQVSYTPLG